MYKLNKSLYGLKQSGRNWNLMLHKHLTGNHFVQNRSDHCVYSKQSQSGNVVVVVWVDDFIIAGSSKKLLCAAKHMMTEKFKMKDLGRLSYFLGIDFVQGDGYVKMNHRKYIQKLLERYDVSDSKPRTTPSERKHEIGRGDTVDVHKYSEVVQPRPNALDFSLYIARQMSSIVVCCRERVAKHSQLFTRLGTQHSTDVLFDE